MSALGIGLAWMGFATLAFLVLSASALARTHRELEVDPWIPGENPRIRGEAHPEEACSEKAHSAPFRTQWGASDRPQSPMLPKEARTLRTRSRAAAPQPRLGVSGRERRGALADASW
jgi:hypothetical protein